MNPDEIGPSAGAPAQGKTVAYWSLYWFGVALLLFLGMVDLLPWRLGRPHGVDFVYLALAAFFTVQPLVRRYRRRGKRLESTS